MEQEQSLPGYCAIIPAEVRYHDKLSPSAKLLYGEITVLASREGYCWASNAYFARLYSTPKKKVATRTIRRWISSLRENGFVKDLGITKNGFRKLGISFFSSNDNDPQTKIPSRGGGQKRPPGGEDKKDLQNGTRESSSLKREEERKDRENLSDSSEKNPSDLKPKKRKHLGKEISPAMEIIEHWKSKQGFRKPMLKTVNKIKKHLENNILPKYSLEQIKQSMDNFECETVMKISITDFFILSRYQRTVNKAKLSHFEIFLDTELSKLGKKIQENYNHNFLTDDTINSKKQINDFNNAAKKLIVFMKGRHLEKAGREGGRIDYIFLLFGAIEEAFGDSFGTGNLCSDYTFNTLMPKYIKQTYGG